MNTRPISLIHLRSSDLFGSPERLLLEQVRLLPPSQFRCAVASFTRKGGGQALLDAAAAQGVTAVPVAHGWRFSPLPIRSMRRVLHTIRPDILCTHDYKANIFGFLAARRTRVRTVAVFHGWTSETTTMRLYEALDRWALRRMDHVVAVSESNRRRLLSYRIPPNRITTVRNGIDALAFATSAPQAASAVRASFGIPLGAPLIVSAGRLSPEKGHRFLLDAFRRLTCSVPGAYLALLGDGPESPRLRAQAVSSGIADRVIFAGFRSDVAAIFHAMEFLVLPSLTEGLPMVVLEAFACGKPVVASAVGGVPEVVQDHETGLLVPPTNPDRLARAMQSLLIDRSCLQRMGALAAHAAHTRFNIDGYISAFADVFRSVARDTLPAAAA